VRKFLEALAETGDVPVPGWAAAAVSERHDVTDLLVAADAAARLDAPGAAPAFHEESAAWAARILFRACCALADRAVAPEEIGRALGEHGARGADASAAWSVDLFLRHLPELHGLARGLAPGDPLVAQIEELGAAWPLSSVGMPLGTRPLAPTAAIESDPCLRRVYADRVIRRGDASRLAQAWVAGAADAALGAHRELAPAIGAAAAQRGADAHGG
jgi:hypothetical protein